MKPHFFHKAWQNRPQLINNPVILRELTDRLRRKSSFVYLFVFLIIATLLCFFTWNEHLRLYTHYGAWLQSMRSMFLALNFYQGMIILLLAPLLSATSINLEKEQGSWDLLLTTPLHGISILWGKFLSSLLFVWILLLSLIPIYGLFFLIGGVSPEEVVFCLLLITEVMVITGLFGLLCSLTWKQTVKSISMTYLFSLGFFLGIPFLLVFLEELNVPAELYYCTTIGITTLFTGMSTTKFAFLFHSVFVWGVIILLSVTNIWMLSRKQESSTLTIPRQKRRKVYNHSPHTVPLLTEDDSLLNIRNAIRWKELREIWGPTSTKFFRSIILLFGLDILVYLYYWSIDNNQLSIARWGCVNTVIASFIIPILIIPYAANCIRSEQDRDTWELLLSTLLTPAHIVKGKISAGMRYFTWRFLAFFSLYISVFIFSHSFRILPLFITILFVSFISAFFYLSIGTMFSALLKKTIPAYACTFATAILVLFVFPLFFAYLNNINVEEVMSILSPLFLFFFCVDKDWWMRDEWYALACIQMGWMLVASYVGYLMTKWRVRSLMR